MKISVLNPFTIDPDIHSDSHGLACRDESLTVQADAEQSDINFIVRQFGVTKELPYGGDIPSYDDFSDAPNDFHQAMNYIRSTDEFFMEFPANVRAKFDNDAGALLDYLADSKNYDEAVSLGIVLPRPSIKPDSPQQDSPASGESVDQA